MPIKNENAFCEPHALRRLYEASESYEHVGRRLGVSGGAVRNWLGQNKCPKPVELASLALSEATETQAILVLRVTGKQRAALVPILEALRIKCTEVEG